ncbi:MAG: hypothetical protein AAB558_02495 [Patescibacteria group bacterium]
MLLGGLRRTVAISASLILAGGLVWGCTHQVKTVLPTANTAPINATNSTPTQPAQLNTNTVTPSPSKVYTENANQEVTQANVNVNVNGETIGGNEATEETAAEVDVEAQNRDTERVARITQIQQALESYRAAHQSFPEVLDGLREGFLNEIPKDVDGDDFSYTPIGALPAQFYDLCYELEVGTDSITSGYHCASPEGIAHP